MFHRDIDQRAIRSVNPYNFPATYQKLRERFPAPPSCKGMYAAALKYGDDLCFLVKYNGEKPEPTSCKYQVRVIETNGHTLAANMFNPQLESDCEMLPFGSSEELIDGIQNAIRRYGDLGAKIARLRS